MSLLTEKDFFTLTIGDIWNDGHGQTKTVLVYGGNEKSFKYGFMKFQEKHNFDFKEFREYEDNVESAKLEALKKEVGFEQEEGESERWFSDEYLEFIVHCVNTMGFDYRISHNNISLSIGYGLFY